MEPNKLREMTEKAAKRIKREDRLSFAVGGFVLFFWFCGVVCSCFVVAAAVKYLFFG